MDNIMKEFAGYGLPGIIIAVLFFENFFLIRKITDVIDNNTRAMAELKQHCSEKLK
jgi:hypothetical protein